MHYAQFFRKLRELKGLSHEALAGLARCHRNTILNVEGRRPVKFKTLARLMGKMGYATNSAEMASLALLWLESVSGLDLADPARLGPVRQKITTTPVPPATPPTSSWKPSAGPGWRNGRSAC